MIIISVDKKYTRIMPMGEFFVEVEMEKKKEQTRKGGKYSSLFDFSSSNRAHGVDIAAVFWMGRRAGFGTPKRSLGTENILIVDWLLIIVKRRILKHRRY